MPIYEISQLGTASNFIQFNNDAATPYYRLLRRTPTRRELEEFDIKLPEQTGDADFQTFIGKTYLMLDGVMYPDDDAGFDNGRKALRKLASLDVEQADANSDMGYVPYQWPEHDGYNKQIFLKVLNVDMPETTRSSGKQPFRLLCKIKYPVIFGQSAITTVIGSATATVTGGIGYPFSYPVAYGANTYSSNGAITNPGDLKIFPSGIVVNGPVNVPRVTNSTTGQYIEVNVNLATTGDSIIIAYDQDSTVITQAGTSVLNQLTSGSTFFKLTTGINNLTLTGASIGTGANATVSMLPAWPLS